MSFQRELCPFISEPQNFNLYLLNESKIFKIDEVSDTYTFSEGSDDSNMIDTIIDIYLIDVEQSIKICLPFGVFIDKNNKYHVTKDSDLYPLISYVSNIDSDNIICEISDMEEALKELEFKGQVFRQGNTENIVLIPIP